jgi:hypothetical protein
VESLGVLFGSELDNAQALIKNRIDNLIGVTMKSIKEINILENGVSLPGFINTDHVLCAAEFEGIVYVTMTGEVKLQVDPDDWANLYLANR